MNKYMNVYLLQVRMNCIWNLVMKGEYKYDLLICELHGIVMDL
ncbi:hypothetical protein F383_31785 [Gossypium arboreum]|uniref:Uncharacterized protein n=1 Tax=Gossypium arboreum TaxID=29729 RepID=A0A0B0MVN4_GOSAR|nr:hypothetical protein F383_31785 [Gossypium arboreum]